METKTRPVRFDAVLRILVAYRLLVYLGGLAVIGLPLVLAQVFGIVLPPTARTVIVVVTLTLMVLTYVGERRISKEGMAAESGREYRLRMRLALALAAVGVAIGVYVALAVNLVGGILFVVGAYLFAVLGYRTLNTDGHRQTEYPDDH